MGTRELRRFKQLEKQIAELRRKHPKIYEQYERAKAKRLAHERAMHDLFEERDKLAQGQLQFPIAS
jgi:chromosome segregation ATPase